MNYEQIKEKLEQYGQTQLLRFYGELDETQKETLLDEISRIDFDMLRVNQSSDQAGVITPIEAMTLDQIKEQEDAWALRSLAAINWTLTSTVP